MIVSIWTSKIRNGFMESSNRVECVLGKGIIGDRYFVDENRPSDDYQATFIEKEQINKFNTENAKNIAEWEPRRNFVTLGVSLNGLVGKRFRIGSTEFMGLELCEPCKLLESRINGKALVWFKGRGGLRAKIIQSGFVEIGDKLEVL